MSLLNIVGYCINSVKIKQKPKGEFANNKLAIIPHLNFSCNGRITHITAKMNRGTDFKNFPYFQVWRPSSTTSLVYHKIGEVQLKPDSQEAEINNKFLADINLTGNDTIEFRVGDVIGCYHPHKSRYQVTYIKTKGYVIYQFNGSLRNSVNTSEANQIFNSSQPLIQFTVGMKIISQQLAIIICFNCVLAVVVYYYYRCSM